ncbi:MAG: hypothetical protein U0872_07600 [Planctomycetaceae bacterium]
MSDRVEILCGSCEAKLTLRATPEQLANRNVRCPKCQSKFLARPEMIRVVGSESTREREQSRIPVQRKPKRVAQENDEDGALPEAPRISLRPKKTVKREEHDEQSAPEKKRKKSRSPVELSLGMAFLLWTFGGIAGGIVGGGVWGLVAYLTGWQIGFLSILIGTTVGIGVRVTAGQYEGWMPAITSVCLTLATVFLSKLTLNCTLFFNEIGGMDRGHQFAVMSQERLIAEYASEVVAPEYRKAGKPIMNQQAEMVGMEEDFDDSSEKDLYHPAFWTEAESRWKALSPQEQTAFNQLLKDRAEGIDRRSLIDRVAEREVKPEFERTNQPVFLTEAELATSDGTSVYKSEVLQEAEKRLDAKSESERAVLMQSVRDEHAAAAKAAQKMMLALVLIYTLLEFLWPSTIVCLIFACISAYQIGNYDGITT